VDIRGSGDGSAGACNQPQGHLDLLLLHSAGIQVGAWKRLRGGPPFDLDRLAEIHAKGLRGAIERGEFVETTMRMRRDDLMTYGLPSMQFPGMHEWAGQSIVAMAESDSRSRQWLSWWAQRPNLQLRH
jgi:hypothetical protein